MPDDQNFALAPGLPRIARLPRRAAGETLRKPDFYPENLSFYHGVRDRWPAAQFNWALQQPADLAAWQKFFRRHPLTNSEPASNNLIQLAFPVAPEPQAPAADVLLALSRYDSALALLRAANQRPKVRYPLAYEDGLFALAWLSRENFYYAAHILGLRAVAELALDQSEAALQDTLLALRLADSFQQEPYDILHRRRAEMLRLCLQPVWEGLAAHRWNEAQLLTLQQRFAGLDLLAGFRVMARGETLVMMNLADQFLAFLEGRGSPFGNHVASAMGSRFWIWLCRTVYPVGWLYQDKVWIYRFYERRADVFKALDPANQKQWEAGHAPRDRPGLGDPAGPQTPGSHPGRRAPTPFTSRRPARKPASPAPWSAAAGRKVNTRLPSMHWSPPGSSRFRPTSSPRAAPR